VRVNANTRVGRRQKNRVRLSPLIAGGAGREIRLKPLVALGGYIPCPDHRIAPDAKFENVRYYCDRMRKVFG